MSTITVKDGTTIYYKDWKEGSVITCSHGWPLCSDAWDGQMPGTPINSPGEDWSFLQGHFARMSFNIGKVRQVAASRHPILIEDVAAQTDWVVRPEWAKREDIRSFAGHPLIFRVTRKVRSPWEGTETPFSKMQQVISPKTLAEYSPP